MEDCICTYHRVYFIIPNFDMAAALQMALFTATPIQVFK